MYADAFGGPPRREGPDRAEHYLERLSRDVARRPGLGFPGGGGSPEPAQGGGLTADRVAGTLAELPRVVSGG
ncbi:hypothetical protein ACWGBV_19875 [Streptomyces sp. NPDC055051]